MSDIVTYFEKLHNDLSILSEDINRIAINKKNEGKEDVKKLSMRSLMRMTTLRDSKEALIKAKEEPEVTFITDRLNEIFGK
jgi:hypothetical protein